MLHQTYWLIVIGTQQQHQHDIRIICVISTNNTWCTYKPLGIIRYMHTMRTVEPQKPEDTRWPKIRIYTRCCRPHIYTHSTHMSSEGQWQVWSHNRTVSKVWVPDSASSTSSSSSSTNATWRLCERDRMFTLCIMKTLFERRRRYRRRLGINVQSENTTCFTT